MFQLLDQEVMSFTDRFGDHQAHGTHDVKSALLDIYIAAVQANFELPSAYHELMGVCSRYSVIPARILEPLIEILFDQIYGDFVPQGVSA